MKETNRMRNSKQRNIIVDIVQGTKAHFTADRVYEEARKKLREAKKHLNEMALVHRALFNWFLVMVFHSHHNLHLENLL